MGLRPINLQTINRFNPNSMWDFSVVHDRLLHENIITITITINSRGLSRVVGASTRINDSGGRPLRFSKRFFHVVFPSYELELGCVRICDKVYGIHTIRLDFQQSRPASSPGDLETN
ncbi:hypothetical protein V6N11_081661 [Hibiscus sabdariffa]|uniref:Uncharacterized protein n=1 Tax=Hibiscus sabdariffa TaxID=183260 RepID=A0ABR1Z9V3_9ROSI